MNHAEYDDLKKTGSFRPLADGTTMEGKWFGMRKIETAKFLEEYPDLAKMVEVKIPIDDLEKLGDFTSVDDLVLKREQCTFKVII